MASINGVVITDLTVSRGADEQTKYSGSVQYYGKDLGKWEQGQKNKPGAFSKESELFLPMCMLRETLSETQKADYDVEKFLIDLACFTEAENVNKKSLNKKRILCFGMVFGSGKHVDTLLTPKDSPQAVIRDTQSTLAIYKKSTDDVVYVDILNKDSEFSIVKGNEADGAKAAKTFLAEQQERKRLAAEEEKKRLAEEEKRRQQEAEKQRLAAAEAEKQRLAAEAEKQRMAAEAEKQRIAAAEAERQRLEAEAEKHRVEAEAEQQRLAAEAEQQRLVAEAEKQRLAAEAEQQRLAAEAEQQRLAAELEKQRLATEAELEKQRLAAEAEQQRLAAELEKQRLATEAAIAQAEAAKAAAEQAAAQAAPAAIGTVQVTETADTKFIEESGRFNKIVNGNAIIVIDMETNKSFTVNAASWGDVCTALKALLF